jgi:hypothetical protein
MRNNGFKVRGLDADTDRVSIQSTHQQTHLLTRRKFPLLPAKWTLIEIERDELIVIKCNRGNAEIEIKHLGGPHGALVLDQQRQHTKIRAESRTRVQLKCDEAVFLHTEAVRHPLRRESGMGVGSV